MIEDLPKELDENTKKKFEELLNDKKKLEETNAKKALLRMSETIVKVPDNSDDSTKVKKEKDEK